MSCSNTSATRKELKCVNLELKMFFHWWTNLGLVFILGAKVFDVQVAPWHTGTGLDPHRENPVETENSIPPFALPTSLLSNPALGKSDVFSQEMWHRFIFFRSSLGWDIEPITLKFELAKMIRWNISGKSRMAVRSCSNATVATAWSKAHLGRPA